NQNQVGFDPGLQRRQRRERRFAILICAGERFLKSVIARQKGRGSGNLLVALLDQLFENLRAALQAGLDLSNGVLAICASNDQIGRALEQRQKRDQEKKQAAAKTAKSKSQR